MMNEFGQIVAWWFTTGTGMDELKDSIVKLKKRHRLLGFDATDRCCQERTYWESIFGFLDQYLDLDHIHDDDIRTITVVDMPYEAREPAYTIEVGECYMGQISEHLMNKPPELQVAAVDCEWRRGATEADVITIKLMNDEAPYIFSILEMCKRGVAVPRCVKDFLEDPHVMKVGNRICSDISKLEGWGIFMASTIELGHLARDRAVSPTRAPGLGFLVSTLWPGVETEGKDGDGPRISNWSGRLTVDQIRYASNDGYITMKVYQRLMQIMDPKVERRLLKVFTPAVYVTVVTSCYIWTRSSIW